MGGVPLFLSSPSGMVGNITNWGFNYTPPQGKTPPKGGNESVEKSSKEEEKEREAIERIVQRLRSIDQKVRAHELAHMSVGGQYAGAPHYTYVRGPDGRLYAVAGEVPIDVSPEKDPEATVKKMQQVIAAALAPADPSPQDYRVAALASQQMAKALNELAKKRAKELYGDFSKGENYLERFLRGEETSRSPQRGERNNGQTAEGQRVETIFPNGVENGNPPLGDKTLAPIFLNRKREEKINSP